MEELLRKLRRKLQVYHIEDLMKYLCLSMAGVFVLDLLTGNRGSALLCFDRAAIFRGQIWRLVTFLAVPPAGGILSTVLYLYFSYVLGSMLERQWGSVSFNMYYLLGWLCCAASGLLTGIAVNDYLNLSLLLAFSMTYPEQQFLLFFIVPIRAKWMAAAVGVLLLLRLIVIPWALKVCLVFSLLPFFLFFGKTAIPQIRSFWYFLKRKLKIRKRY